MKTEHTQIIMDGKETLQLGRTYMLDAQQCEMESDYIAAEGIYHICCDIFSGLAEQDSLYGTEAKGEYMHTLFRYAMLPQIGDQEKLQYLEQAYKLADELEKATNDMEYTIAVGCIEEEIRELNKTMERQLHEKQQNVFQF